MIEIVRTGGYEETEFAEIGTPSLNTALIDADSLLYYCMGAGTFQECKLKFDNFMLNILTSVDTFQYLAFLTPHTNFRYDLAVSKPYKGNRKGKLAPPEYFGLKAYARQEWQFQEAEGLEADDVVAYFKCTEEFKSSPGDLIICSPDKDVLRQVPGRHLNYGKNEWIKTSDTEAYRFLWRQALMGDSVDGIPGIPGIGDKKAEAELAGVSKDDLPLKVLQMYLAHPDWLEQEALSRFQETYDLVYLLRNDADLKKHNIEMKPFIVQNARELCQNSN